MSNTMLFIGIVGGIILMVLPSLWELIPKAPADDIDPVDVIVPTPIVPAPAPAADNRMLLIGYAMAIRDALEADAKCTTAVDACLIPALLARKAGGK